MNKQELFEKKETAWTTYLAAEEEYQAATKAADKFKSEKDIPDNLIEEIKRTGRLMYGALAKYHAAKERFDKASD